MAIIMVRNLFNRSLPAADLSRTVLQHFHDHHLDWMHACGGKGRCTTCKLKVINGHENLSPLTEAEERYIQQGALLPGERLSCQVRIQGDIEIAVPQEGKLAHIKYSE
jgi:2Fe-2S ferredoxin